MTARSLLTTALNHGFNPTLCSLESSATERYTEVMFGGAGIVPGRVLGALITDLRACDNLVMMI